MSNEKCSWDKMGYSTKDEPWYHIACINNDTRMLDPKEYPKNYRHCPFCGKEIDHPFKFGDSR